MHLGFFSIVLQWAHTQLAILSLIYCNPLSICLSLTHSHKCVLSSLPLISSSMSQFHSFYSCLCLSISPLSTAPRCAVSLLKKRFPLTGYNKQLFAVWNNKDCHHGYSSIPWALSGPFRVLKGAIIWWHQRQHKKSKARGTGSKPFIRQVGKGSCWPSDGTTGTGMNHSPGRAQGSHIKTIIRLEMF